MKDHILKLREQIEKISEEIKNLRSDLERMEQESKRFRPIPKVPQREIDDGRELSDQIPYIPTFSINNRVKELKDNPSNFSGPNPFPDQAPRESKSDAVSLRVASPLRPTWKIKSIRGLEQSQTSIVGEENRFGLGNRNCFVNMCFYYAIYHLQHEPPYRKEDFVSFLNRLADQKLIRIDRKYMVDIDIRENIFVSLMSTLIQRILFVTFDGDRWMILRDSPILQGEYEYLPLSGSERSFPWENNRLMVVALVMGKSSATANYRPNHYIALKLNRLTYETEIIDSIYHAEEGAVKAPIDRSQDPVVQDLIRILTS